MSDMAAAVATVLAPVCDVPNVIHVSAGQGTDKLTRKLGQTLPNISPVASYVTESTHPDTTLSLSVQLDAIRPYASQ